MSAQVHSVPGQTKGRRKAFLEWKNIYLSSKLYITRGGDVKSIQGKSSQFYCKSAQHPIPTVPDAIRNT